MSNVFILQNALGYFYSKSGEWVDGRDVNQLYRSPHKDEALNQLFEANSRNYELRLKLVECELNSKKQPQLEEATLPPPLAGEPEPKETLDATI